MINRDSLNTLSPQRATQVAFRAIDAIQDLSPEEQSAGIAVLFLMLCKRNRLTPREVSEVLEQSGRRIEDALQASLNDKPGDVMRALRMYLKEQL